MTVKGKKSCEEIKIKDKRIPQLNCSREGGSIIMVNLRVASLHKGASVFQRESGQL